MPGTLSVACKLPNGLQMDLKMPDGSTKTVILAGSAVKWGAAPVDGGTGYAITTNVDADFYEEWMKRNASLKLVRENFIFALPKAGEVRAKSHELSGLKTGMEPLDPEKPAPGIEPIKVAA